jgi:hypothetical protein
LATATILALRVGSAFFVSIMRSLLSSDLSDSSAAGAPEVF